MSDLVADMRNQIEHQGPALTLHEQLEAIVPSVERAIGRKDLAERVVRIALTEVRKNPQLAQCTVQSIMGAILQSAQLKLDPGGALGHCWLVPMKDRNKVLQCEWWLGYKGIVELAHRSGMLTGITADVVRENDRFEAVKGTNGRLIHEIDWRATVEDRGPVYASYAHARLANGGEAWEVLPLHEIERRRSLSRGSDKPASPWVQWFDQMASKCAVQALSKWLPASVDYGDGAIADQQVMRWDPDRPEVPPSVDSDDVSALWAAMPETDDSDD